MRINLQSIKTRCGRLLRALLNPSFLLCFGIAWMVTNGWCYVFMALGSLLHIHWMFWAGTAYAGFLWMPFTPEKLVTLALAILLLKLLFPSDVRTLQTLHEEYTALRLATRRSLNRFRQAFRKKQ